MSLLCHICVADHRHFYASLFHAASGISIASVIHSRPVNTKSSRERAWWWYVVKKVSENVNLEGRKVITINRNTASKYDLRKFWKHYQRMKWRNVVLLVDFLKCSFFLVFHVLWWRNNTSLSQKCWFSSLIDTRRFYSISDTNYFELWKTHQMKKVKPALSLSLSIQCNISLKEISLQ